MTELRPLSGLPASYGASIGPHQANAEFDIRHILSMLRRRYKLILSTILILVGLTAVALVSVTPIYRAAALVLVDPSRKNLLDPAAEVTSPAADSARVESETEILRSDSVLMEVIRSKDLINDDEFGVRLGLLDKLKVILRMQDATLPAGEEALGQVLRRLKQSVSIQRRGLTHLIAAEVSSTDASKAASLANALIDAYVFKQVQAKIRSLLGARDIVQSQILEAQNTVVSSETAFNNYIFDNLDRIIDATGRTELYELRNKLEALSAVKSQTTQRASNIRQSLSDKNWSALVDILQTEAATALAHQRDTLLKSLANENTQSEAAANMRAELAKIEASLESETRSQLASVETLVSANEKASTETRRTLNSSVLGSDLPPDILAQIYGLQQMSRNATSQYQALLARSQDLETQSELQMADSRIVSEALPPIKPAFPNVPMTLSVVGLLALGAGIGLAFMFEYYIGGFTEESQLEQATKIPVSSVLPRQKIPPGGFSVSDTIVQAPLSRYAESVRRLRVSIDQTIRRRESLTSKQNDYGVTVMVSSALPGEGKTTVALSLARTYATAGSSVLLIDCDLRKPSVHRHLGVQTTFGLGDMLLEESKISDLNKMLFRDPRTSLTAILGARRADLPTDRLVTKSSFQRFLAVAAKRFDLVILDSPPIEPVVDGLYLAQYADVIAFVVHWARTPQQTALGALDALASAKSPTTEIVTVINQQDGHSLSYGYRYSSYYSE